MSKRYPQVILEWQVRGQGRFRAVRLDKHTIQVEEQAMDALGMAAWRNHGWAYDDRQAHHVENGFLNLILSLEGRGEVYFPQEVQR